MKDNFAKVIIGFVTFSAFCAACSPMFFMNSNGKPAKTRYFDNNGSTFYTRSDYKKTTTSSDNRRSYGRVIYLGEPIEGVMDFN